MSAATVAVYISRGRAQRCVNCDGLTDAQRTCPGCGSGALVSEDRLLERSLPDYSADYESECS